MFTLSKKATFFSVIYVALFFFMMRRSPISNIPFIANIAPNKIRLKTPTVNPLYTSSSPLPTAYKFSTWEFLLVVSKRDCFANGMRRGNSFSLRHNCGLYDVSLISFCSRNSFVYYFFSRIKCVSMSAFSLSIRFCAHTHNSLKINVESN